MRPRKPILSCLSTYSNIYGGIPVVVGTVPLYSQTSSSIPHEDSTTCLITDDDDDDDDDDVDDDDDQDDEDDESSEIYLPTSDSSTAICTSGRSIKKKNLLRRSVNRMDSVASTSSSTKPDRSSSSVSLSLRKPSEDNPKDTRKSLAYHSCQH